MSIVSNAVKLANSVTKNLKLQSKVTYQKNTTDGTGKQTASGSAQLVDAVVDYRQRQVKTKGGQLVMCTATVTFLDPTLEVGFEDDITLADGTTGPILTISGPSDGDTGKPAMREVTLG